MIYRVEGYTFETEEEARLAGKEAEGIKYIRTQNDMSDPDTVLKLYNRLIEKEIFATPVGFAFLEELHRELVTIPYIRQKDMLPLPIYRPSGESKREADESGAEVDRDRRRTVGRKAALNRGGNRRGRDYYKPFVVSTFLAIVFGAALLGIFIIMAISSNNVTILNYENQLIDRYERWEKELIRREDELKKKEQEQQFWEDSQWTD